MTPTAVANRSDRIQRTLEHLRQHTTDTTGQLVPFGPGQYTDPGLAQRERDLVFGRVPSIVAHASELPEPNDFITLQMPRNRVIVARQLDGSVKAFVNVCRHRGALLEEQESGRCRLFSCGYHRWSYNTDGSLRTITREATFGEVDRSRHGLIELPAQERHGLIWMVDRAGAPIDVAAWLGPEMDEILAGYRLGELTAFRSEGFDEPANWKLMQDAFVDNYHIQYAHPNTAGKHIHTNVQTVEDFGRHARMVSPRKAIDRWLEEDPGDTDLGPYVTEGHFLLPNSTLLRQPDDHFELLTFRPHPADPGRCRMEMRLLVPPLEASGMEPERYQHSGRRTGQILLAVLHQEDFPLLRSSQQGLASADAGRMLLGRNEMVNQIFHRELRDAARGGKRAMTELVTDGLATGPGRHRAARPSSSTARTWLTTRAWTAGPTPRPAAMPRPACGPGTGSASSGTTAWNGWSRRWERSSWARSSFPSTTGSPRTSCATWSTTPDPRWCSPTTRTGTGWPRRWPASGGEWRGRAAAAGRVHRPAARTGRAGSRARQRARTTLPRSSTPAGPAPGPRACCSPTGPRST